MTPTLTGRWQTRLLLFSTIGVLITFFFAWLFGNLLPFVFLAIVMVLGFIWDIFYTSMQSYRWDNDWPPVLQLAAGIFEGFVLWGVVQLLFMTDLPALIGITEPPAASSIWLHYGIVWISIYVASQSIMRLIYPRWRYYGGQWLGRF